MRAWIAAIALLTVGPANAATYHILYDASPNRVLGTDLVGSGTFGYDGAPVAGSFALSTLTGLTFAATVSGHSFTTADLQTSLSISASSSSASEKSSEWSSRARVALSADRSTCRGRVPTAK